MINVMKRLTEYREHRSVILTHSLVMRKIIIFTNKYNYPQVFNFKRMFKIGKYFCHVLSAIIQ